MHANAPSHSAHCVVTSTGRTISSNPQTTPRINPSPSTRGGIQSLKARAPHTIDTATSTAPAPHSGPSTGTNGSSRRDDAATPIPKARCCSHVLWRHHQTARDSDGCGRSEPGPLLSFGRTARELLDREADRGAYTCHAHEHEELREALGRRTLNSVESESTHQPGRSKRCSYADAPQDAELNPEDANQGEDCAQRKRAADVSQRLGDRGNPWFRRQLVNRVETLLAHLRHPKPSQT